MHTIREGEGKGLGSRREPKPKRGLSFKVLVAVPFCIALAIQGAICVAVLAGSDIFGQMDDDAYDLFSERVASRAGYLENDMVFRWSDIDAAATIVADDIDRALAESGATYSDIEGDSALALSVIDASADNLVTFARRAEVDGVYLVLDNNDGGDSDAHSAFYVRDSNPQVDVSNGSDLLLAACPISVGRRLGIALDSQWSATFALAPEGERQSEFYYKPLRAAEQYRQADSSDLGYWGKPVDLGWAGTSSVTYSRPVKDAAGNVCGVLGVEVRLDRLAAFYPYTDLSATGNGSYILATTNEDGGFTRGGGVEPLVDMPRTYQVLNATGASQSLYVQDDALTASLEDGRSLVEPAADGATDGRAVIAALEIPLYDSTSPFASEHWALVGLEREDELFAASSELSENLIKVFIASLVVGLVVAVLVAWASSSRLRRLMGEVRATRPEEPIAFTPTGIVEVDELSDAIEYLGSEVSSAASRLSQVLHLSDRSIGAFEYSESSGAISYTDGFFDTLKVLEQPDPAFLKPELVATGKLTAKDFERLMSWYVPYIEVEGDGRYLLSGPRSISWVRLVIMTDQEHDRVLGLVEDVTHEIETRRRIEHERDHDILTGLLNRRAFEQTVTELLRDDAPAFGAMLMLDLDNLKFINDTYGHDWGDQYIKAAGRAVETTFKGYGLCSRVSGDEFLIFASHCADRAQADELFAAFRTALDTSVLQAPDGKVLKVRASMGAAFYPDDATDFPRLREYADFAMYLAKNSRKGELFAFDRASYDEKSFILNSKEDLNRLLDEGLVDYYFQPIVDARAGEVAAFEALMRPRIDSIPTPDRVIALARSQSKLYQVEHLTFFGALEAFSQRAPEHDVSLFVNSIATQRLSSDDEILLREHYGDLLKRLVIEITESDYSREMALYKESLAQRFGARLAIDDYGSGHNGEMSLLDYRVDFVKIDMAIVQGIDGNKDHRDIARNLISYSHDRGIRVVAEGVETESELRTLVDLGVDYLQGYLVGRPGPEPRDISPEAKELIRSLSNAR